MSLKTKLLIAGVDEVGIGPLAGPVIAAAVILNPNKRIPGIRDSKKLTEKQRNKLFDKIYEKAFAVSLGRAEVEEIDTLNIYHATMLALQRAVMGLPMVPDQVWIDGRAKPNLFFDTVTIVDGDESERVIGAASIIAKVTRDREMVALDKVYSEYQFAKHKGYSTKLHKAMLAKYGPSAIHRKSFAPVRSGANCLDLPLARTEEVDCNPM